MIGLVTVGGTRGQRRGESCRRYAVAILMALGTVAFAGAASAQKAALVTAEVPDSVLDVARGWGSATLDVDGDGDPIIRGKINGLNYSIFFYNCTKNQTCTSIRFSSVFQAKPNLETINSWNGTKRFAFGFLDKDGDAALGLDVDTVGGISRRAMDSVFDRWSELLAEYARHIGFRS